MCSFLPWFLTSTRLQLGLRRGFGVFRDESTARCQLQLSEAVFPPIIGSRVSMFSQFLTPRWSRCVQSPVPALALKPCSRCDSGFTGQLFFLDWAQACPSHCSAWQTVFSVLSPLQPSRKGLGKVAWHSPSLLCLHHDFGLTSARAATCFLSFKSVFHFSLRLVRSNLLSPNICLRLRPLCNRQPVQPRCTQEGKTGLRCRFPLGSNSFSLCPPILLGSPCSLCCRPPPQPVSEGRHHERHMSIFLPVCLSPRFSACCSGFEVGNRSVRSLCGSQPM